MQTEDELVGTAAVEAGGMSWEHSTDTYTLPRVKHTARGSSAQRAVTAERGGMGIYVHLPLIYVIEWQNQHNMVMQLSSNLKKSVSLQ